MADDIEKLTRTIEKYEKDLNVYEQDIEIFKHGLSRLSVVSRGLSPKMDDCIAALRNVLKKRATSQEISKTIDDIAEESLKLEESKKNSPSLQLISSLCDVLCQLPLARKELKALDKIRNRALKEEDEVSVKEAFTETFYHTMQGLLNQLKQKSTKKETTDWQNDNETQHDYSLSTENVSISSSSSYHSQNISTANCIDEKVIQVLNELMMSLNIPEELEDRAYIIKEQLKTELPHDDLEILIGNISALVLESFSIEQNYFKAFLEKLTDRFGDVGSFLNLSIEHEKGTLLNFATLQNNIEENINDIQSEFIQTRSIDPLIKLIEQKLKVITSNVKSFKEKEIARLKEAQLRVELLQKKLIETEEKAEALRASLVAQEQKIQIDSLTQLANRESYDDYVHRVYQRYKLSQQVLALAIGDLDNFKAINDRHGHLAGDEVLAKTAELLKDSLRDTDFIARYGGEEFVFVFEKTAFSDLLQVLEKLRQRVEDNQINIRNKVLQVTMSFGISAFTPTDKIEDVFARADDALYEAKGAGRNCIKIKE